MTGKTYQCETCGQQVQLSGEIPSATECCGAKWIEVERLPACEMPALIADDTEISGKKSASTLPSGAIPILRSAE